VVWLPQVPLSARNLPEAIVRDTIKAAIKAARRWICMLFLIVCHPAVFCVQL
jgi:hypothetical protein